MTSPMSRETALAMALQTAAPGEHWSYITERAELYLGFLRPNEPQPKQGKPETVAVELNEGDGWTPWVARTRMKLAHAVKFSDGSEWDIYNGWRFK